LYLIGYSDGVTDADDPPHHFLVWGCRDGNITRLADMFVDLLALRYFCIDFAALAMYLLSIQLAHRSEYRNEVSV